MNENQQWAGHGQPEMADLFQVILEATPQLPIDKLARSIKSGVMSIAKSRQKQRGAPLSTSTAEKLPKTAHS